jgi:hypothetical protein
MSQTHLVSFATTYEDMGYQDTELRQNRLIASAEKQGIHSFFTWTRKKLLKTEFYKQNKFILDHKQGAGYYLWKPYIILDALNKINDGDMLIYADNSMYFINNPMVFTHLCNQNNGFCLFTHQDYYPIKYFCQKATFEIMGLDYAIYADRNISITGIIALEKNDAVIKFVAEWLQICRNPKCLMENFQNEDPDFRRILPEMSILSLLKEKYSIQGFKIPYKQIGAITGEEKRREEKRREEKSGADIADYPTIFAWDKQGFGSKRPLMQKINPKFIFYKLFKNK